DIPEGTYRIEYSLDQSLGGQSSATVRSDDVSVVSLASARKLTRNSGKKSARRSNKSFASSSAQVSTTRGMIEILSPVTGAVVYLDNQKLGTVNTTYRKIRPGQRTIIVRKIGYDPLKIRITVKAGELTRVTADLIASGLAIENEVSKAPADPNPTANELYLAGRELFMDGSYDEAYSKLNGAIAEDPSIADAFFIRAQIYQKKGNDSLAGLDYLKAGEIWKSQRRYNDAIASLDQAVLVDGNSATNLKVRGDYYYSRKEYTTATNDYRAALKIDNRYYPAQRALAVTMYRKGAYRGADKELRRARDLNPNDATLYHYLMLNSLARNDLGDVNKYFKEFKKVASDREMTRYMTDNGMEAVRRLVKN
ncbi:MAG: PEGA domain-containing protein, partial [candidate division Zixibacteria bacterium]|nr:PEGA domain-containing protein [candidate division Zixibacteria bacterium]